MWPVINSRAPLRRLAVAAVLLKISKHTALLISLLILGKATGRLDPGQLTLLGLAVVAALLHLGARKLQRRPSAERISRRTRG